MSEQTIREAAKVYAELVESLRRYNLELARDQTGSMHDYFEGRADAYAMAARLLNHILSAPPEETK